MPGNLAMETGELPPIERDPSKPLKRPRFRPMRLTIKVVLFVAADLHLRPAADPGLPGRGPRDHPRRAGVPGRRLLAAVRGVVRLLAADPLGARRVRLADRALAHVPDPDEHEGAVEHRARRQRRRLGARLPPAHAVGHPRPRRRLRPGDGRPRVGRRAQPASSGPPCWCRSRSAASTRCTSRPPCSGSASCSSSPCSSSGCSTGRGAPRRSSSWLGRKLRFDPDTADQRAAPDRPAAGRSSPRTGRCSSASSCGPASTGCSTRRRCGCSSSRSTAASRSTPCSSRSAWPTSSPSSR